MKNYNLDTIFGVEYNNYFFPTCPQFSQLKIILMAGAHYSLF